VQQREGAGCRQSGSQHRLSRSDPCDPCDDLCNKYNEGVSVEIEELKLDLLGLIKV